MTNAINRIRNSYNTLSPGTKVVVGALAVLVCLAAITTIGLHEYNLDLCNNSFLKDLVTMPTNTLLATTIPIAAVFGTIAIGSATLAALGPKTPSDATDAAADCDEISSDETEPALGMYDLKNTTFIFDGTHWKPTGHTRVDDPFPLDDPTITDEKEKGRDRLVRERSWKNRNANRAKIEFEKYFRDYLKIRGLSEEKVLNLLADSVSLCIQQYLQEHPDLTLEEIALFSSKKTYEIIDDPSKQEITFYTYTVVQPSEGKCTNLVCKLTIPYDITKLPSLTYTLGSNPCRSSKEAPHIFTYNMLEHINTGALAGDGWKNQVAVDLCRMPRKIGDTLWVKKDTETLEDAFLRYETEVRAYLKNNGIEDLETQTSILRLLQQNFFEPSIEHWTRWNPISIMYENSAGRDGLILQVIAENGVATIHATIPKKILSTISKDQEPVLVGTKTLHVEVADHRDGKCAYWLEEWAPPKDTE